MGPEDPAVHGLHSIPTIRYCRIHGWDSPKCRKRVRRLASKCVRGLPIVGEIVGIVDCFIDNRGSGFGFFACLLTVITGIDGIDKIKPN